MDGSISMRISLKANAVRMSAKSTCKQQTHAQRTSKSVLEVACSTQHSLLPLAYRTRVELSHEARPDVNLLDHYHFLLAVCTRLRLLLLVDHELASLIFQHRQHRQRWEQRLRLARIL